MLFEYVIQITEILLLFITLWIIFVVVDLPIAKKQLMNSSKTN